MLKSHFSDHYKSLTGFCFADKSRLQQNIPVSFFLTPTPPCRIQCSVIVDYAHIMTGLNYILAQFLDSLKHFIQSGFYRIFWSICENTLSPKQTDEQRGSNIARVNARAKSIRTHTHNAHLAEVVSVQQ